MFVLYFQTGPGKFKLLSGQHPSTQDASDSSKAAVVYLNCVNLLLWDRCDGQLEPWTSAMFVLH